MVPGWMQFTRMPSPATWSARFLAMLDTEALVTPLLLVSRLADRAAMPPMLMMRPPPRWRMWGITSRAQRT